MASQNTDPFKVFKKICSLPGSPSHFGPWDLHSSRLNALRDLLSPLEFTEEVFRDGTRVNFYLKLPEWNLTRPTTVVLAHHDTVLETSHALDNSGSVSVLVALAHRLSGIETKGNVLLVWDDAEEVGGLGGQELASKIKRGDFGNVRECINLEMIGTGTSLFIDGDAYLTQHPEFRRVTCPYSDGTVLRSNDLRCSTIGTLSEEELAEVVETGFCDTWSKIHSPQDSVDLVEPDSLERVVSVLERYLKA